MKMLNKIFENITKEPECVSLEVFSEQATPTEFRMVEVWSKDAQWYKEVCHCLISVMICAMSYREGSSKKEGGG